MQEQTVINSDYEEKIDDLKRSVLLMLQERADNFKKSDSQYPGVIWSEGLRLFDYVINLSAENYLNIRFHAGYITGCNVLQHWHQYPPFEAEKYANSIGYKFYTQDIPQEYWASEPLTPDIPRPMGVDYRGKIINQDVARYQSCITNLYSMGIFDLLKKNTRRNLILEVGGGYGGLAHYLGNLLHDNSTYVIVDLPEILLFSGGFLIVNNPSKKIYLYEKSTFTKEFLNSGIYEYDYVLLPNYALKDLYAIDEINLMINMQSFQEMTITQIEEYLQFGQSKLSGYLYSDNMDRHPFNGELAPETVTTLLSKYFWLFPETGFYRKVFGQNSPWFYKCYTGVLINRGVHPAEQTGMKFMSGPVKYSVWKTRDRLKYRAEGIWLGRIIMLGLKILQVMFRL